MLTKIVLGLIFILIIFFTVIFLKDIFRAKAANQLEKETSFWKMGIVGFIALFLDSLGIGSFNTITPMVKNFKLTKDKTLPGTLMVSTTLGGAVEAFIFVTVIKVDPTTLIVTTIMASLGAFIGAGIISKLPEKLIQLAMGTALAVVALLILLGQLKLMPSGGTAIGLSGMNLIIAGVVVFILGAMMNIEIGFFAPCMALVYAMGMSPAAVFPIMMVACAFLQPTASLKFIREGTYDRKASLAIAIFGVIGALIAFLIVKSIPLDALKWIILAVVLYTSLKMFKSYSANKGIDHGKHNPKIA